MNVLFICDEYPPGRNGGIGTMVQVLGRELVRQGHNVFVAGLYAHRYGEADYEEDHGVKVYRLRYGIKLPVKQESRWYNIPEKFPAFVQQFLNGKKAFKKYIRFVEDLIEKEKIDIIEIQDWNSYDKFIGITPQIPNFTAPLVVKSNGSQTYFADEMGITVSERFNLIDKLLYQRADALSAVSKYTGGRNEVLFNIDKPIEILYNSIETPYPVDFSVKKREQTVMFTGTLLKKKGIYSLMHAWNKVNKTLPHAELHVYGKGNIDELKNILDEAALKTVHFKGHTTRDLLFEQLSKVTLAIFPSYSECFALAPLEAMAVGCPIVNTSRSSGMELVTDKENGSLIDPDDIDGIASAIIELISDKALQEKYSRNGFQTIMDKFNIAKSAQDHVLYYGTVIDKFNGKTA